MADGGQEFMDFDGIERSNDETRRIVLHFSHPHCPGGRGTNKNQNRILMCFHPKGSGFFKLSPMSLAGVQEWMDS